LTRVRVKDAAGCQPIKIVEIFFIANAKPKFLPFAAY
jgi:hypothetical protein